MIEFTLQGHQCTVCKADLTVAGIGLVIGAAGRIQSFTSPCHVLCVPCARPILPQVQQMHDEFAGCPACNGSNSDPHAGYPGCFSGAAPAPNPPASRCCGAGVFEERGRTICQQCRVGCKLR